MQCTETFNVQRISMENNDIFNSVLRPFQDYFSSYETGQSVGGRKQENPEKKKQHLAHPQAELGLSHMWPVRVLIILIYYMIKTF